jgi:hypothetical protein
VGALQLFAASTGEADTFTVANGNDSGTGSLRAALGAAETNANGATVDQIDFTHAGNIDLDSILPQVTTPMTINGPGAGIVTVRRNPVTVSPDFQLFPILPETGVTITIRGLTFADAQATGFAGGALIKAGPGTLILDSVVVKDNTSDQGGGLFYGNGFTSIRNSTFSGNKADSGAAIIGSQVSVTDHGEAELINSTVDDNHATMNGGGIELDVSGHMRILSSTITRNEADSDGDGSGEGGGLANFADDPDASDEFEIANTLLAENSVGDDSGDAHCTGSSFTSLGYNLRVASDTGCIGFGAPGDFVDASPMIAAAPATNGGTTPNVALLSGSPAINAGNPAALGGAFPACPATDQRGLFRGGVAGNCDIGSYELNASSTPPGTGEGQSPPVTTTLAPTFNLAAAIRKCKRKFPKGPKRKKCIRRAKQRAQGA